MYFSSPTSHITPAYTSVAMSRSDSRDSTSSTNTNYMSYAPTSAYTALMSASPTSWPTSHALARTDSNTSNTTSHTSSSSHTSIAMRRDSGSNSSWLPSPYRSCMSSFGSEPNSYLSDDDLLCPPDELSLPIETIPTPAPKKELTTEEQIAMLRELQEKEAAADAHYQAPSHYAREPEVRRKVVRFASQGDAASKSRRPSTVKRRQTSVRRGLSGLNGPQ